MTMEQLPDIRMLCPKCRREFGMDAVYCDDCSAMLEPVETEASSTSEAPEEKRSLHIRVTAPEDAATSEEKIEDVAIENLKADIEEKFVNTLLLELDQLRKRLNAKENHLSGIQESGSGSDQREYLTRIGTVESEIDDLLKKITRIETILDNLRDQIGTDISQLEARIASLDKPGVFGIFSDAGKYYRMLSSELRTKKALLDVILKKQPRGSLSPGRLKSLVIAAAVFLIVAASLAVYFSSRRQGSGAVPGPRMPAEQKTGIAEQDIVALLEDIKKANLSKDISLWESRYSKGYLAAGKREGIIDQWSRIDYRSLYYVVEDIRTGADSASAVVTWRMELASRSGGSIKTVEQRLLADFVLENGALKIASVRKQ